MRLCATKGSHHSGSCKRPPGFAESSSPLRGRWGGSRSALCTGDSVPDALRRRIAVLRIRVPIALLDEVVTCGAEPTTSIGNLALISRTKRSFRSNAIP